MSEKRLAKLKILFVEDDEDFNLALASRLKKRSFEVIVARTAEEALDKFRKSDVDIIIADIKLPGIDGMEFLARVREINDAIPVILITGYASLDSAKEAVKLNASDYLLKPLENIDDLLNPINKAVYSYKLLCKNKELTLSLKNKIEELKKSEQKYKVLFEQARESEEKFKTIAEYSPNMIFINTKGRIAYVNKKCEDIMGYTKEEFYSADFDFRALIAQDALKIVKTNFNRHMREKEIPPYEYALITKDGRRIEAIVTTKLITYEKENAILGIITDITERKAAEGILKDSEAKLREQKEVLEQKNIALKEILNQIEIEKNRIKDDIFINADKLLSPILKKLRRKSGSIDGKYIDVLEFNLEKLTSSFGRSITEKRINLTLREIEIANMVKSGLTSKEISGLLNLSLQTTERHRNNIRKKLGIINKDVNLGTYLQNL